MTDARHPAAADPARSRGRQHPEPAPRFRDEYQRDRDRIIHSTAFRRLEYKTQVFVNHEGDLYRTRLTHSLEVAQVGRTVARALGLNEDLTEAICLAHDLGHTPFGHAGQTALNRCMAEHGGFEHNLQSLRVVDKLEEKYPAFDGLNLTFETREGILKHCAQRNARRLGSLGERFLNKTRPGLEAQLADLADAIAYNNHDVDDGLRSGLISVESLRATPLFAEHEATTAAQFPALKPKRHVYETIRRMIGAVVNDLIRCSRERLAALNPQSADDVRAHPEPLIGLSAAMLDKHLALKRFLNRELYQHPRVSSMTERAKATVEQLFVAYRADTGEMPASFRARVLQAVDEDGRARVVADYIAGMTDRYAIAESRRLATRD